MTVDSYLGSLSSMQLNLPKPDPQLADEFRGAINKAIELAEKRLKQRSNDIDAMYDAGAAYGVQATLHRLGRRQHLDRVQIGAACVRPAERSAQAGSESRFGRTHRGHVPLCHRERNRS